MFNMTKPITPPEGDVEITDNLDNNKPDYEALLAQEKERREEAERKLEETRSKAREAFKERQKKREEDGEPEDKPLTRAELEDILSNNRQEERKDRQRDTILSEAKKLAKSEEEAQYIVEIHRNRRFPEDMSISDQLLEAQAISAHRALRAENDELKRSLLSKETKGSPSRGHQLPEESGGESTAPFKGKDAEALANIGYQWDAKSGLYNRKTKDGRTIVYDPKTKKTSVQSRS